MELTNPYDSGIAITDITGIGPGKADINVTELTSSDGSLHNSSRLGTRNIVMTLRFMFAPDIETVRQKTYRFFPIKKELTLTFETDNRSCYITGYVESNEPVIFEENEYTQISIVCPDPYFYSLRADSTVFSGVVSMFEFPFSNEVQNNEETERFLIMSDLQFETEQTVYYSGESEIGMTIRIRAIGTVENLTIFNTRTREFIKLDTDKLQQITGSVIIAGDEITICTVKGKKSIRLLRDGVTTNILNCMTKDSSWIQLVKGDNILAYTADSGAEKLHFSVENNVIYEGV
ncbi:phage distal tail protein [Blautia hydrogenotrophica]|uniref:phage distal tail protein n=1 Tax=Blautia hydrogenotrophica TaxID=53443 RepID=UPI00248EB95F|nr:phage tail domain-containing protein [Blautia hydrogenotrophica]